MPRTASVFTRVDPTIKSQAEAILNQLGISMSTAMEIYLRQIALQRKIPFEIQVPQKNKPISYESLSDEDFNALMDEAAKDYAAGKFTDFDDFKKDVYKELGL